MWISFQNFCTYFRSSSPRRGFTLIELMVATSIIVIITTVLLFRHQQFNSSTLLRSLAYSVALSVRQAQLYGISVRSFATGEFAESHGVQFFESSPTTYYLFADLDDDGARDIGGGEDIDVLNIHGGFQITRLCATRSSPQPTLQRCTSDGTIDELSILFRRPDPDSNIRTDLGGEQYQDACIELATASGATRAVTVTQTGQISVGESDGTCL